MTEYELSDLINSISSNIIQGQAVYLTTITAYLVVAYSVGAKLTRFQVSFVNFVYILFGLVGVQGQLYNFDRAYYWRAKLVELSGKSSTSAENATPSVFITVRRVMLIGSLFIYAAGQAPQNRLKLHPTRDFQGLLGRSAGNYMAHLKLYLQFCILTLRLAANGYKLALFFSTTLYSDCS